MSFKQAGLSFKRIVFRARIANELWYHRKGPVKHKIIFDLSICEHDDIKGISVVELTILGINIMLGITRKEVSREQK